MTDSRDADRPGAQAPRERLGTPPQRVYGTTDPWTSQGTGAQRFKVGDPVRLRTAGVVDDLDPDDGVHVRFDTSGAWMQPGDLEPPPPVDPADAPARPALCPEHSMTECWECGYLTHAQVKGAVEDVAEFKRLTVGAMTARAEMRMERDDLLARLDDAETARDEAYADLVRLRACLNEAEAVREAAPTATPDWFRRAVQAWIDTPGHPDDAQARRELQYRLNRAQKGRPDLAEPDRAQSPSASVADGARAGTPHPVPGSGAP